ncbi:aminotransferase class I/II-fold pyridoxal phosphate-dependent enzyme [Aliivibrio sifiae]|uniref:2-amino-3-ketobutyrate CoA ligase n=1 Tax=Aliivibrio sifiae TaxID=566293 RepID=A0A2S7XCI1_9GAMM|nr:aminotransferase class I/II-fold pyridoxal phosphate-dependent enzyme [Aliivibrio sifiae]PQJ89060.1 2-amino-3-ketobutyrate CoA ligase [Aliivibrio sifiae]
MDLVKHHKTNYKKVVDLSEQSWEEALQHSITSINASVSGVNQYQCMNTNNVFSHFCTTSYLGLEFHPSIIQGAIDGVNNVGVLRIPNSRNRLKLSYLYDYEERLSSHFRCEALATLSCSSASSGILPLLASGVMTNNQVPVLAFDKFSHYSMNHTKAACSAETDIVTIRHNNMEQLEDLCKREKFVAYVADGAYSMGGVTKIDDLMYLQERYGLFLYLDDSHSLSAFGSKGEGFVKSYLGEMNNKTIIVSSLGKAFGASGGLAMLPNNSMRNLVNRYGGPSNWSQSLNSAGIGAGMASLDIHESGELQELQQKLQDVITYFDSIFNTKEKGNVIPIRLLRLYDDSLANRVCSSLLSDGFFTSSVFFPVVPRGQASIRVTLRADMTHSDIDSFYTSYQKSLDFEAR